MDAKHFDSLVRSMMTDRTRRGALITALGGTLALLQRDGAVTQKKKGKGKGKGKGTKRRNVATASGNAATPAFRRASAAPPSWAVKRSVIRVRVSRATTGSAAATRHSLTTTGCVVSWSTAWARSSPAREILTAVPNGALISAMGNSGANQARSAASSILIAPVDRAGASCVRNCIERSPLPKAARANAGTTPTPTLRVSPVTVTMALDQMSSELLPALTDTGPGSMTSSPVIPV